MIGRTRKGKDIKRQPLLRAAKDRKVWRDLIGHVLKRHGTFAMRSGEKSKKERKGDALDGKLDRVCVSKCLSNGRY